MNDCKPVTTSISTRVELSLSDGFPFSNSA